LISSSNAGANGTARASLRVPVDHGVQVRHKEEGVGVVRGLALLAVATAVAGVAGGRRLRASATTS
jgi:hypothetical protein